MNLPDLKVVFLVMVLRPWTGLVNIDRFRSSSSFSETFLFHPLIMLLKTCLPKIQQIDVTVQIQVQN